MEKTSLEIMQSIIGAEIYSETHLPADKPIAPPLVTISRSLGARGNTVAALVAQKLGVPKYDRALLKEIAKTAQSDSDVMARLDERVTGLVEEFLHAFLGRRNASTEYFYRAMVKVIMGISHSGGVIVGRGAHILLSNRKVFRVRLEASLEVSGQKVANKLGITKNAAQKLVKETNKQRTAFVRKVWKRAHGGQPAPQGTTYYDLQLNTDLFTAEQAADIIFNAMKTSGFPTEMPR